VPGQEFVDAVDGVIGDAGEHVAQVCFRIDVVQLRGADQAVDCGSAFAAGIRSREQVVLAAQGHHAQCSFRGVVVDFDAAIVQVAQQRFPAARRRVGGWQPLTD